MIISSVIFGVLALLMFLGLGKFVLKDFRFGLAVGAGFLFLVFALNFIPTVFIGGFSFRIGTMLFYLGILTMFFVYGRLASQMTSLAIGLMLGGVAFASARLAYIAGGGFFADTNAVYAVIIALIAVAITRNGKYAFLSTSVAMLTLNLLTQIGNATVSLQHGFAWTAVAIATALVVYSIASRVFVKPSRASYYFEVGRLED
ncbi:MAG: hypothetical protein FWD49_03335 [Firmicutes bacterium]|nr:hypothetical protein [Bacillota bacterium]